VGLYHFPQKLIDLGDYLLSLQQISVSREPNGCCRVVVRNFERDGGGPTAIGEQALAANHFMLLKGKPIGSKR